MEISRKNVFLHLINFSMYYQIVKVKTILQFTIIQTLLNNVWHVLLNPLNLFSYKEKGTLLSQND